MKTRAFSSRQLILNYFLRLVKIFKRKMHYSAVYYLFVVFFLLLILLPIFLARFNVFIDPTRKGLFRLLFLCRCGVILFLSAAELIVFSYRRFQFSTNPSFSVTYKANFLKWSNPVAISIYLVSLIILYTERRYSKIMIFVQIKGICWFSTLAIWQMVDLSGDLVQPIAFSDESTHQQALLDKSTCQAWEACVCLNVVAIGFMVGNVIAELYGAKGKWCRQGSVDRVALVENRG